MERGQRKDSQDGVSPELRKYIRIQIAGMSIFLSWLPAIMLADMYGLTYAVPQISVLLPMVALVVFLIGTVGKQEFKENTRER